MKVRVVEGAICDSIGLVIGHAVAGKGGSL